MWYKYLEKKQFLLNLYDEIPNLNDVRIEKIELLREGTSLSLTFDLPKYPSNPPHKWEISKYNTATLTIIFYEIFQLELLMGRGTLSNNIVINYDNHFMISVNGDVRLNLEAKFGYIKSINGYNNSLLDNQ